MSKYKIEQSTNAFILSCGANISSVQTMDLGSLSKVCNVTLPSDMTSASGLREISGGKIKNVGTLVLPTGLTGFTVNGYETGLTMQISKSAIGSLSDTNGVGVIVKCYEQSDATFDGVSVNGALSSKGYSLYGYPYVWKNGQGVIVEGYTTTGNLYVGKVDSVSTYGDWVCAEDAGLTPEQCVDFSYTGTVGVGHIESSVSTSVTEQVVIPNPYEASGYSWEVIGVESYGMPSVDMVEVMLDLRRTAYTYTYAWVQQNYTEVGQMDGWVGDMPTDEATEGATTTSEYTKVVSLTCGQSCPMGSADYWKDENGDRYDYADVMGASYSGSEVDFQVTTYHQVIMKVYYTGTTNGGVSVTGCSRDVYCNIEASMSPNDDYDRIANEEYTNIIATYADDTLYLTGDVRCIRNVRYRAEQTGGQESEVEDTVLDTITLQTVLPDGADVQNYNCDDTGLVTINYNVQDQVERNFSRSESVESYTCCLNNE